MLLCSRQPQQQVALTFVVYLHERIKSWHEFSNRMANVSLSSSDLGDFAWFLDQTSAHSGLDNGNLLEILQPGFGTQCIRICFADSENVQIFDSEILRKNLSRLPFWCFKCFTNMWVSGPCYDSKNQGIQRICSNKYPSQTCIDLVYGLGQIFILGWSVSQALKWERSSVTVPAKWLTKLSKSCLLTKTIEKHIFREI